MRTKLDGRTGMAVAFLLGAAIASAGTATATQLITGRQIKDGTIAARDLSPGLRAQLKRVSAAGATSPVAPQAVTGATGPAGPVGPTGPGGAAGAAGTSGAPGTARAYAVVVPTTSCPSGNVDCTATRARNVSRVRRVSPGDYCVTVPGLSGATAAAAAGIWFNGTFFVGFTPEVEAGDFCGTSEFAVSTNRVNGAGAPFDANDVSFWFLVP